MIDDLRNLNRLIAMHWLGPLDPDQEDYVDFASVCVGRLTHSATELTQVLARLKEERWNRRTVGALNRRFLSIARLAARDASTEGLDMLVRLGLTLGQAAFLRSLSDADLNRLAFGWAGAMIRFEAQSFHQGVTLHVHVSRHHATAFVAAQQITSDVPQE